MTELPFVAGALGEWLVGRIADAGMRAVGRGELAVALRARRIRRVRCRSTVSACLSSCGWMWWRSVPRPHEAIALADEALLLARTAKLHVFAIRCLVLRASALLDLGRVAVARAALAQARDLVATSPTPIVPVIAMRLEMHCARAAGAEGDAALGAAHLAAADAALGSEEDPITRAQAMEMAAGVLTDLGEHALAGETLRRALATWRELDVPLLEGLVLLRLARHATLAGDNGAASAQLAAAAALLEGTEHRSALDAAR